MQIYNIHHAKTQLSRLVEQAMRGSTFIIAKAGKPMVKVIPVDAPDDENIRRIGFMAGHVKVPDDFDYMGEAEITAVFEGDR